MKCPYCDHGVSRYSEPGFNWPCTICNGTGELPDDYVPSQTKSQDNKSDDKSIKDHEGSDIIEETEIERSQ